MRGGTVVDNYDENHLRYNELTSPCSE